MSSAGSITQLIRQVHAGESAAWDQLYERMLTRLLAMVRLRLMKHGRANNDGDDVLAETLLGLYHGIKVGRFTRLRDRNDLWRLLSVLVRNKAYDALHAQPPVATSPLGEDDGWELADSELPLVVATLGELEVQRLLALLPDQRLRDIAIRVMEGYTQPEIASMLQCSLSTVERKLARIRKLWAQEVDR